MLLISSLRLKLGLPPRLQVGSECQGLHNVTGVLQSAGHIHQGPVADQVGQVVDGPVHLRLCAVEHSKQYFRNKKRIYYTLIFYVLI